MSGLFRTCSTTSEHTLRRGADYNRLRRKSDLDEDDREGMAHQFLESRPKKTEPCTISKPRRSSYYSNLEMDNDGSQARSLGDLVQPSLILDLAELKSTHPPSGRPSSHREVVDLARESLQKVDEWSVDSFTLVSEIGNGGYGLAYKAVMLQDLGGDVRAGDEVCVKMALDSKSCDEQVFAEVRALNQARCLGTHPNVVRILGYNTMVRPYFVVMELVYGWSLRNELRKRGPIPLHWIGKWTVQILAGMQHLHATKLLHRDLKSSNIMLNVRMRNTGLPYDCASALGDSVGSCVSASSVHRASSSSSSLRPSSSGQEDGKLDRSQFTAQAKIVDFGTSANLWRGGSQKLQREMGTLNWMPPEVMALQKSDAEVDYGTSADVYSVGMVIYEMLSGLTPYHDSQKLQIALKVDKGLRPSLRGVECPPLLEWMMRYCLHAEPHARPSTAQLLLLAPHLATCGMSLLSEAPRARMADALEPMLPHDSAAAQYLQGFTVGAFLELRKSQEDGAPRINEPARRTSLEKTRGKLSTFFASIKSSMTPRGVISRASSNGALIALKDFSLSGETVSTSF